MLENIKNFIVLKSVDKLIKDKNFETALNKINTLIQEGFMPAETFLKRGQLCKILLMSEEAYSDFTYIINHCIEKNDAYYERMKLNFEIGNFIEAINDASRIEEINPEDFDIKRIKAISMIFSDQHSAAFEYLCYVFNDNKYRIIQFILNETARNVAEDSLAKALKLLEFIDTFDKDNPMKMLKEANIYGLAGDEGKEREIMKRIDSVFPKYFISHFRFTDIYEERDLLEICFLIELKIFDYQNLFSYPMVILEGYKNYMEGHILDSKECFERAITINPNKPDAYVLLGQTLQLMSGYDNPEYITEAEKNYKMALDIYENNHLSLKAENMKKQIKHLNSSIKI